MNFTSNLYQNKIRSQDKTNTFSLITSGECLVSQDEQEEVKGHIRFPLVSLTAAVGVPGVSPARLRWCAALAVVSCWVCSSSRQACTVCSHLHLNFFCLWRRLQCGCRSPSGNGLYGQKPLLVSPTTVNVRSGWGSGFFVSTAFYCVWLIVGELNVP